VNVSRSTGSPWWSAPWTWIAIGLAARLAHVLSLGDRVYFGDTPEYEQIALRILHGVSLGEASPRAPLYPLWLALSYAIGGEENHRFARLVQVALCAVQMTLAVGLATRIGNRAAGAAAAVLVALTPTLVFVSGLLYPTVLYSTLLLGIMVVAWDLSLRPGVARAALLGVLVVAGWLTDMVIVAPLTAVALWLLVRVRRPGWALARALAVTTATTALLALPTLQLLRSQGGDRVFMGKAQAVLHFARTDPVISRPRWIRHAPGTPFVGLSPGALVAREWGLLRSRPGAYLHDYAFELLHFFQPLPDRVTSQNRFNRLPVLLAGAAWFSLVLLLAVAGAARGAGPGRGRVLLAGVVLATAAFYAFFFSQTRYRIPVEPQLIVLASLAIPRAFPRLSALLAPGPAHGPGRSGA
jgi:hypothetical protein